MRKRYHLLFIYISINNYLDFWSRTNSNTFICNSEFHTSYEAIIRQLTTITVKLHSMIYKKCTDLARAKSEALVYNTCKQKKKIKSRNAKRER